MTDQLVFLQLMARMMDYYGVTCSFAHGAKEDPAFWEQLMDGRRAEEHRALEAIAACLRRDTGDFACIDEIIAILEPLCYDTNPRHDFG